MKNTILLLSTLALFTSCTVSGGKSDDGGADSTEAPLVSGFFAAEEDSEVLIPMMVIEVVDKTADAYTVTIDGDCMEKPEMRFGPAGTTFGTSLKPHSVSAGGVSKLGKPDECNWSATAAAMSDDELEVTVEQAGEERTYKLIRMEEADFLSALKELGKKDYDQRYDDGACKRFFDQKCEALGLKNTTY